MGSRWVEDFTRFSRERAIHRDALNYLLLIEVYAIVSTRISSNSLLSTKRREGGRDFAGADKMMTVWVDLMLLEI